MYDKDNDIERILSEDIRDKKRTGTGIYHRASRRGYVGSVRTQSDYLTPKQKRLLNGECVTVGNIYDDINNIPSIEQLRAMEDKSTARSIITVARAKHKMKELTKHWGFSDNYLYVKFFPEFGINTSPRKSHTKNLNKDNEALENVEHGTPQAQIDKDESIGFSLRFVSDCATGKMLKDRLMSYLTVLEDDAEYDVKFIIAERIDA